jgi:hypothetical protein
MTPGGCAKPIEFETLLAYWMGELPAAAEAGERLLGEVTFAHTPS